MSKPTAEKANAVGKSNGIHNPTGACIGLFSGVFILAVPVTSYFTHPDSPLSLPSQHLLSLLHRLFPRTLTLDRSIPQLATLYTFFTYAFTGALSGAAQAMGIPEGLNQSHPRANLTKLSGLPLRMYSAHNHLLETFPGWALAAALSQILAPGDRQILNLLGLHVLVKCFIYYPGYCADLAGVRNLAHLVATGCILNVGWRLATVVGS